VCHLLIKHQISFSCRFSMLTVVKGNKCWKVLHCQISNIMELSLSTFIRIFIFRLRKYLLYVNQFYLNGYSAQTVLIAVPTPSCTQWLVGPLSLCHEADLSYSCSAEVKNEWRCTWSSSCALMVWRLLVTFI